MRHPFNVAYGRGLALKKITKPRKSANKPHLPVIGLYQQNITKDGDTMNDFTLPTNIKQIGSIGDGLRIYIEDYVCTFLHQYAEAGGYAERLAFLVGRHMMIDGQPILFINGAIHGKHTEEHEGFIRFSEKSRDYAETILDEHFPMMEIVGWMQSQPSYGTYLNQHYASYHLRQFRKPYQVMFVLDPIERNNAFYSPDSDALTPSERMAEVSGYFIYYEKNVNMHEYMLANKVVDYTAKSPTIIERTPLTYTGEENEKEDPTSELEGSYDDYASPKHRLEPEEIIRRHQADKARRKAPVAEQRRALNMVASLCAVLFIVSFILGVGYIRNQDRISTLEQEIQLLTTGYRNLFAQLNTGELAPAFAEQDPLVPPEEDQITDDTALPVTEPTHPPDAQHPGTPTPPPQEGEAEPEEAPLPFAIVPETYTIQYGDSLIGISRMFFDDDTMIYEIMALNGLDDPDHIVAGRTIALPRR